MTISNSVFATMASIGKAVEKGVTEDTRTYLDSSDNATNNAIAFLRGDYINTNLKNILTSADVEVKLFRRSSWTGALVIDHVNQSIFSVCSKKTLARIPKNKSRRSPHYTQTMLNTINRDEVAPVKQITMADIDPLFVVSFSEEDYEKDFVSIMETTASQYEGYRFWIISYDVERFMLTSIEAVLLDGDYDTVKKISILEMLKPNFGDLTSEIYKEDKNPDVRSLLSVKTGLRSRKSVEPEKRTAILPKSVEENKEA